MHEGYEPPLTANLPIDQRGSPFQLRMLFEYYSKDFFWEYFVYARCHRQARHGSALPLEQKTKHKAQIWTLPSLSCDGQHWSVRIVRYSVNWMIALATNSVKQVAIVDAKGKTLIAALRSISNFSIAYNAGSNGGLLERDAFMDIFNY